MEEEITLPEARTDEEKHYQPEWLEKRREEMGAAMAGMTPEERVAYIRQEAAWFREKVSRHNLEEKA
jgi:hypothetical protein